MKYIHVIHTTRSYNGPGVGSDQGQVQSTIDLVCCDRLRLSSQLASLPASLESLC